MDLCETCEAGWASRKGECATCAMYRLRTGRQRPPHLAARQRDLNWRRIRQL